MKTKLLLTGVIFMLLSVQMYAQSDMWALTRNGGANSQGAIISMNPSNNQVTVRHSFLAPDGYHPYGNLLQANDGNIYGTCYDGGNWASCTIFKFEPGTGYYTDVYDFDITHGDYPTSGLIQGPGGILYGAAAAGGTSYSGVIYSWNTNTNTYTMLYSFSQGTGQAPYGAPVFHSNGKIYGMTVAGGAWGSGVIYSYDISNSTYTMLFSFGSSDGMAPYGSLLEASDGKLYGLTSDGGTYNKGVLFSFDPVTNVFSKKAEFTNALGYQPKGSLIQASDGMLYGTASMGGNGYGTIFRYDISNNTVTNIYSLAQIDGSLPIGDLYERYGYLFGTTFNGGVYGMGTAFRILTTGAGFTKLFDFNGTYGQNPTGAFIVEVPTGLESVSANSEIAVYPNPVSTNMVVALPEQLTGSTRFTVQDVTGKIIFDQSDLSVVNGSVDLNLQALPSGIYLLRIDSGNDSYQQKFVKQ